MLSYPPTVINPICSCDRCLLQYGELRALAALHAWDGNAAASKASLEAAARLQQRALDVLWSRDMGFLGTLKVPRSEGLGEDSSLQSR